MTDAEKLELVRREAFVQGWVGAALGDRDCLPHEILRALEQADGAYTVWRATRTG